MKYIDAEEITPIMAEYVADVFSRKEHLDNISYGYCMEIADVFRRYAERAEQEQPKKSQKSCNDCPHCVDRKDQFGWHFKGCFGGPYNGKFIAEIDECPLQQEPIEKDEETSVEIEYNKYYNKEGYNYINLSERIERWNFDETLISWQGGVYFATAVFGSEEGFSIPIAIRIIVKKSVVQEVCIDDESNSIYTIDYLIKSWPTVSGSN